MIAMLAKSRKRRIAYCRWAGALALAVALVLLATFMPMTGLDPRMAFGCPPLPPEWDAYPAIGCNTAGQDVTNEISVPANGTSYHVGQIVNFTCTRAADCDRRNDNGDITYPADSMASSGYPYWDSSSGNWYAGNKVGTSVYWVAPASPAANISITVTEDDLPEEVPEGETGSRDDGARQVDSRTVHAVGVVKIQWLDGQTWTDMTGVLYVVKGTTVEFKAVRNPSGVNWPPGKPVWGGSSGASGTGETKSVTFNTVSSSPTNYKTVTAECGNIITAAVIVYEVDHLEINAEGSWQTVNDSTPTDIVKGSDVTCRAIPNPQGLTWPSGKPTWSGLASGSGAEIAVSFDSVGTWTLTATAGNSKSASFRVFNFKEVQYRRSGEADSYYKTDGGGVNGSVLVNAAFQYRCIFDAINPNDDDIQFSQGADPLALRWEVWDLDWWNESIYTGVGKIFSQPLGASQPDLGTTRVRFYIDENWNGERDWWWWGDEPVNDTARNFENREDTVRQLAIARASTTSGPSDGTADTNIADANSRIQIRNTAADYRALCEFTRDGSVTTYTVDADHRDIINTEAHYDALVNNVSAAIRVVKEIYWPTTGTAGLATLGSWGTVVVEQQTGAHVWVHELGHTVGLGHTTGTLHIDDVMYWTSGGNGNLLSHDEAKEYE